MCSFGNSFKGWCCLSLFAFVEPFFAMCSFEVFARGVSLQRTGEGSVVARASDVSGRWYRLEWSLDFRNWEIARDTFAWPSEVVICRPGVEFAFYRSIQIRKPEPPYTLAVIGDSTAAGILTNPNVSGWAEALIPLVGEDARFIMAAEPGLSSKTFFGSNRRSILKRAEPLVVLIQLGQIDEFTRFPEVKGTSLEEYDNNLRGIVSLVRQWDGTPILVTPLPSSEFAPDGNLIPYLGERSRVMRRIGDEMGVYVLDLHQRVSELYLDATPGELALWSIFDGYHLSVPGAKIIAKLTVDALPLHISQLLFGSRAR
ncbi:MAG: Rhamnogalacturonan acetylesterase RhgT [Verrucomicrobia subdivision 3 bacterium]|nr:Rhamnogalacturonan acetylesterase RhgT [Limisphaerales bacterium]MCS1413435.1 Rhamnogalacturonan acetylesterase RhgT [Limisphaerales bacterium]